MRHAKLITLTLTLASCDASTTHRESEPTTTAAPVARPDAGRMLQPPPPIGGSPASEQPPMAAPQARDAGMPLHTAARPSDAAMAAPTARADEADAGTEPVPPSAPTRDAGMVAQDSDAGEAMPMLRLLSATAQGELCPEPSYHAEISSDQQVMTMTFSAAEVQTVAGESREASCKVHLELAVTPGFSFRGLVLSTSGYLFTADAGSVVFEVEQAGGQTATGSHVGLTGDERYVFHDRAGAVWSATCSAAGTVGVDVTLRAAARELAYFNVNALDLDVGREIEWRACN